MRDMGNRIRERRVALGLSQQQLADSIGKPQQTVARWEQGNGVKLDALAVLAERLHCTPGHLLGTDDAPPPPASVEQAVMADERLAAADRAVVLRTYRSLAGLDG